MNIALTISQDWCQYASVTAASVLYNADENDSYRFYIISDNFSDENKKLFLKLNRIKQSEFKFIELDDSLFEGAVHDWLGVSASYRLKLASVTDEDKILYLDSDIIAMENIAPLYSTDISDYYLAAVEDKCGNMMKLRVGLGCDEMFFNSGMQLINLKKFRENNIEEKIFEKLKASTFYTDQDAINDVCRGRILSLPLKYNIMPSAYQNRQEEAKEALCKPVLIHFTFKCWNNQGTIHRDEWFRYKKLVDSL